MLIIAEGEVSLHPNSVKWGRVSGHGLEPCR